MERARERGIGAVVAVCLAMGCMRMNPWWDEPVGSGAGSTTGTEPGDGGSGGDGSEDGGSGSGSGGGSGSSSDGSQSGDDESTGAEDCAGGVPVPGVLCHGDPTYLDIAGAYAVAAGDVSGEGHADIVVGGNTGAWVLIGDGTGGFAPPHHLPGIEEPRDAAIEDLSMDGVNDFVIVGGTQGQTLAVYRNDDEGGHEDPDVYALGDALMGVAPADLDGLGDFGLYAADSPGNRIAALQHSGNGEYGGPWSIAVGASPSDVADGDMNGDGDADLVAANFDDGTVSILLGDGEGGLTEIGPFATDTGGESQQPSALVLADCNRDGSLDVVTANELTSEVVVMTNDGTGAVSIEQTHAVGPMPVDLAAGDLDGDGSVDIVSTDHDSDSLSVLLADGSGGFMTAQPVDLEGQPRHVATADFDEDGVDDWVVTCNGAGWIAYAVSGL